MIHEHLHKGADSIGRYVIFTHPDGMSPMQNMFLTDIKQFSHNKQMPAVGLHYCVIIHDTCTKGQTLLAENASFTHLDGMSPMQKHVFGRHKQFHTTQRNAACEIAMMCHDA